MLNANQTRALRLPAVCQLIGYAPASVWRMVKARSFPTPFKLGARAVAWDEREILDWLEARKASRKVAA